MRRKSKELDRLPLDYTFGIELEFTGGLTSDETQMYIDQLIEMGYIREGWTVHFDKSVVDEDGKGAEIVSPVLHDDEQTEREIEILTRLIKLVGGKMDEKTGCHIHYGVQCLGNDISQIKNYFKLYTIFEPMLYKISIGDLDSVRVGCHEFAKPIQKRLMNVIDSKVNSFTELMMLLAANVGANPTHYGENRYYGLNIQRMIEAIRNIPPEENIEEYIKGMFEGKEQLGIDGEKISPTIEVRFRNGSSSADEIMCGIRMNGQMFVKAKDKHFDEISEIKSLYRNSKKRTKYVFDKVLAANRESESYADCIDDEEILRKKFANSIYGNGQIGEKTFKKFMQLMYPNLSNEFIENYYNDYNNRIKPTDYKKQEQPKKIERTITMTSERPREYVLRAA